MSLRKCLTTVLLVISVMALLFGAFTLNLTKAHADNSTASTYEGTGTFAMVDSVKLRTDGDGFQFKAKMDKDTSESLSSNQKVYFIIIPEIYKAKLEDYGAYRAIARYTDSEAENYGEYDKEHSLCLYVKAVRSELDGDFYYYYGGVSNLATVSQQKLSYYAIAVIETRNDDRENGGSLTYNYTYATCTNDVAPETNVYETITSAILNVETDYMEEIATNYSWFGKEEYPLQVESLEDYNKLVGKLNSGIDLGDIAIDLKADYAEEEGAAEITNDSNKLYSVTFKNGDEVYKTYTVKSGAKVTAPSVNPEKEGYSFAKWQYFDGENYVDLSENATVSGAITLKAVWTIAYTMELNANSATIYYDTTVGAGSFSLNNTHTIIPTLSYTPADGVEYSYESDNTAIATVSDSGIITSGSTKGTATITVTVTDNSTDETLTDTVTITTARYYEVSDWATFKGIFSSSGDWDGYYVLTKDLDGAGDNAGFISGTFNGVFDGNGYSVSNFTFASAQYHNNSMFGTMGAKAVLKNVGLYNVASAGIKGITFIVKNLYGTIENVSVVSKGTSSYFTAPIHCVYDGAVVENLVVYGTDFTSSGFYSDGSHLLDDGMTTSNIYIFANKISGSASTVITKYFATGTSGTDYLSEDEFNSLDFSEIFGDMWTVSKRLGIPMICGEQDFDTYTVTIAVGQDGYGSVSLATVENVPYNTALSVSGNVLTVGETQIIATAAEETAEYTYAFGSWTNVPANVTGAITITANFDREVKQYTITFENYDGTELQSGLVNYGETPVYSGETPTKAGTATYTYIFKDFGDVETVSGNATYTAEFEEYTNIYDFAGLGNMRNNLAGNYILTTNIDGNGTSIGRWMDNFTGKLDGNGYSISNFTYGTQWNHSMIVTLGDGAVIRNLGIYNVATTNTGVSYVFQNVYGIIENVSVVTTGTNTITAIIGKPYSGCAINNFVVYANNAGVSGFFNNAGPINGKSNIYIFSNKINANSKNAATAYFDTTTDYLSDDKFTALNFTQTFNCSANGMWDIDDTLKVPLIKTKLFIGDKKVNQDSNILFDSYSNTANVSSDVSGSTRCVKVEFTSDPWQGAGIRFSTPLTKTARYLKITLYVEYTRAPGNIFLSAGDDTFEAYKPNATRQNFAPVNKTSYEKYIDVNSLGEIEWIGLMSRFEGTTVYILGVEFSATNPNV